MAYPRYGLVSRLLPDYEAQVLASSFGERVGLTVRLPEEQFEELRAALTEASPMCLTERRSGRGGGRIPAEDLCGALNGEGLLHSLLRKSAKCAGIGKLQEITQTGKELFCFPSIILVVRPDEAFCAKGRKEQMNDHP